MRPEYQTDFYRRDKVDDVLFFIEQYPLATVIPDGDARGEFGFFPLLVDRSTATPTLFGHLDNHNPFLKHIRAGAVHAVFVGPNAYISPRDYLSKLFPTWNYAIAQVTGTTTLITDDDKKLALMVRMIGLLETDHEHAYRLDLGDDAVRRMLKQISFFSFQISSAQARFKFSQDKAHEDRVHATQRLLDKLSSRQSWVVPRLAELCPAAEDSPKEDVMSGIDIEVELAKKAFLATRTAMTTPEEEARTFAELARYRDGAIYAGAFAGSSCWERHANGDEMLYVLRGYMELVLLESVPRTVALRAGMLTVVPRNRWHRLHAPDGVTLLTITPLPTEASTEHPKSSDQDDEGSAVRVSPPRSKGER